MRFSAIKEIVDFVVVFLFGWFCFVLGFNVTILSTVYGDFVVRVQVVYKSHVPKVLIPGTR